MRRIRRFLVLFLVIFLLSGTLCARAALELPGDPDALADQLSELLDDFHAAGLLDDLKQLVRESGDLDDGELLSRIFEIAEEHGVTLTDSQAEQLLSLLRTLEKGADAKGAVRSTAQKAVGFLEKLRTFTARISELTGKISDGIGRFLSRFSQDQTSV